MSAECINLAIGFIAIACAASDGAKSVQPKIPELLKV
jgi:hypothetical protein